MFHRFILAGAFLLVPLVAEAQESVTLKFKKSVKGAVTRTNKTDTEISVEKITDKDGKPFKEGNETVVYTTVYVQTVLDQPGPNKRPTLLKRSYEKATVNVNKEAKVLPYQGKTVLIEKKDATYRYRYDGGGPLEGEDAKWLDKEFNGEKDKKDNDDEIEAVLFPKKTVKVGETWNISIPTFVKVFELDAMTLNTDKCKGTGTLVKAYKKDGRQYGDMHIKLDLPLKSIKTPNGDIVMQPGANMVMEIKGAMCIDGSAVDSRVGLSVLLNGMGQLGMGDGAIQVNFANRENHDGSTTEVKKK